MLKCVGLGYVEKNTEEFWCLGKMSDVFIIRNSYKSKGDFLYRYGVFVSFVGKKVGSY